MGYGFDGYLAKPIVLKELEKVLITYLSYHQEYEKMTEKNERSMVDIPSLTIVNMELLKKELDLPDKVLYKLLALFLNSSDGNLLELKTAVDENDFYKIESTAHKIKGAAGNMRFFPIEKLCGEIEILARSQKNTDYNKLYRDLAQMMNTVQEEIKTLLTAVEEA